MLTSNIAIRLRNFTRKLGINKVIGTLMSSGNYEDHFGIAFKNEIRSGDSVWDIGANVGLYTGQFKEKASPDGIVVAFEPTPSCNEKLQELFANDSRVKLRNWAIGENDGEITMLVEDDPLAATHRIVTGKPSGDQNSVKVEVRSAASIIEQEPSLFPNIVKIDVEGHEGYVVDGFSSLLQDPRLRCFGIEMHFGLLEERGESARPKQIERLFQDNGFTIRWTDPSHLLATR